MSKSPSIEQVEWTESSPLKNQLPFIFESGLEFNGFNAQCSGCLAYINEPNLRGSLIPLENNQCLLLAKGYCKPCNGITCYSFKLFAEQDLRVEAWNPDAAWV